MPSAFYSTAEFAELFGMTTDRVVDLIRIGELRAVNISTRPGGRPTWRISQQERERFELARQSVPTAKPSRRQKRPSYLPANYREVV